MLTSRGTSIDGRIGGWERHEFQQEEVQSPAHGEKQSQAPIYARDHPDGKQLGRKGLGVLVDTKSNVRQQYDLEPKKANGILSGVTRSVASRSREELYSALVSPHLKCCAQFWIPQYQTEMNIQDRVQ